MESCLQISFRKILLAAIVLPLLVSVLTITAFILGQKSGLELATADMVVPETERKTETGKQDMEKGSALPRAMTATPKSRVVEEWLLNNEQATQFAKELSGPTTRDLPFRVDRVEFDPTTVRLSGQLNYAGYSGGLEISGFPMIEGQKLHLVVSQLIFDGQDLPQSLFPVVETQVDQFFTELLGGYDVIDLELGDGELSLHILPW